ncbi:MAG: peptidylprolyl isomerase [Alphaproteobacteria bacterium]|nr:peptidylprolyl isomerase [Alphaproteobacteria bacterium]
MSSKSNLGAVIITAVVLAAAAGGAAIYMTKGNAPADTPPAPEQVASASGEATAPATDTAATPAPSANTQPTPPAQAPAGQAPQENVGEIGGVAVRPGNPVIAKVNGQDVTRLDVFQFIRQLPPQIQQMPPSDVYPTAVENVVNAEIIQQRANAASLESDPEFQKQMELAKEQVARTVFLQKEVDAKITEDMLKKIYDDNVAKMPDIEERKASHILVETEAKAREILEKVKGGGDFVALAKAESKDTAAAAKGGDLGWFTKDQMVAEFSKAVFEGAKGALLDQPVQTQFGWHVVKVEDARTKPKPSYEEVKPNLFAEARRIELEKLMTAWRQQAQITIFDVNGDPVVAPAGSAPAQAPAPTPAP